MAEQSIEDFSEAVNMFSEEAIRAAFSEPSPNITIDSDTLRLPRPAGDQILPYNIDLARIDSPLKLVGWLHHLSEKVWFDQTYCRQLIQVVCYHFGWDIHKLL